MKHVLMDPAEFRALANKRKEPWEAVVAREKVNGVKSTPYDRLEYSARQTGRTTNMLLTAKHLAEQGRKVYVICLTDQYVRILQRAAEEMGVPPSVSFETFQTLPGHSFVTGLPSPMAHPNCITLVDHFAIEYYLREMLRELHRYDDGPVKEIV